MAAALIGLLADWITISEYFRKQVRWTEMYFPYWTTLAIAIVAAVALVRHLLVSCINGS